MKKLRIPTKQELTIVACWGGVYTIIHAPYALLYTVRQTARLITHVSFSLENLYREAFIEPMKALIWQDYQSSVNEQVLEAEFVTSIDKFDFSRFKSEPDAFPHLRIIGKSGQGKTVLARYFLHLLGGNQYVITAKKKPKDWTGLPVYGAPFKYDEAEEWLNKTTALMYDNYKLIEQGSEPIMTNVAIDEWRSIQKNVDSAKETMKELISVARDARLRIIAVATGEQVAIWGLEGESDLEECFTTIRLGEFAIEYAQKIRASKAVIEWLKSQKRPCMVDRYPAEIPDLSNFQPTSNPLLTSYQPTSEDFPNLEGGRTAESGFQPPEGLQNGGEEPQKSPGNQGFQAPEGTWESQWEAKFWQVWQAIASGKSNYWIGGNIFGIQGGSSYQKLCERLEEVRQGLNEGE